MMEASNEQINLALLLWNNDHRHRSRTTDDYFYPHEVRSLVERQKNIEVTISLFLAVAYILILAGNGLSFYFFYEAQTIGSNNGLWFFLKCNIAIGTAYQCYVVYGSQIVTAFGATTLLIGSLVKSCCCMW